MLFENVKYGACVPTYYAFLHVFLELTTFISNLHLYMFAEAISYRAFMQGSNFETTVTDFIHSIQSTYHRMGQESRDI